MAFEYEVLLVTTQWVYSGIESSLKNYLFSQNSQIAFISASASSRMEHGVSAGSSTALSVSLDLDQDPSFSLVWTYVMRLEILDCEDSWCWILDNFDALPSRTIIQTEMYVCLNS